MGLQESFFRNHLVFSSVNEVRELAKPLKSIGIDAFAMTKTYDNTQRIRLSTCGDWLEYYYRSELFRHVIFEKNPKQFTTGYILWSWLTREPVYSNASVLFIV